MSVLLLIVGFILLIRGADWLIEGASTVANKFGVSDILIGLTIVAFGTSLPELVVNVFASSDAPELAIGNVLGSNIANILLILGVAAIINPLSVHRTVVNREILFNIFAAVMLIVLVSERLLSSDGFDGLDHIDGVILISYFAVFLYLTFGRAGHLQTLGSAVTKETASKHPLSKSIFKIIAGVIGLFIGGDWIVTGATDIASSLGISDAVIGLTVVAIGTSLPELVTTVSAVRKQKEDIAVGNIVGSNLFNIFWVLGLSAVINPLPFDDILFTDVFINLSVAILLWLTMVVGKYRHQISRTEGWMFVSLYVSYLIFTGVTA